MGTHTEFTGAIRITPQISEPLATQLTDWLELRHMRRSIPVLESLYPKDEDRKLHTLFGDGDFGQDGEFYLPEQTKDLNLKLFQEDPTPEGLVDTLSMNYPPSHCPSLYSDLALVHSQDGSCSYLGWNGAEKAYAISEWLQLIASYLVPRGYHLEGTMFAVVEYGCEFYFIHVNDEDVRVDYFEPETTYQSEFSELFDY